ncbi:MAG TPA: 1,4-alpha-glucan branching protein GlgB [Burkholderiaceae bacterium]|nr:1,4-alpha-glucan branching protein GlgB [Burkholderiaceae bacterium]
MLSAQDVHQLAEGVHPNPFGVLGMHADEDGRLWVRSLVPGAQSVDVCDARSGAALVEMEARDARGVFEALVPRRRRPFEYRLQVRWASTGIEQSIADPYSFGSLISTDDLHYLGEGTHLRPYTVLGAHRLRCGAVDGVRFALWAPNARSACVVGDFNGWNPMAHPMRRHFGLGIWEIFIPGVPLGAAYKYELRDRNGVRLPQKADPYALRTELRPATASRVAELPAPHSLSAARRQANQRHAPVSIYEVHLQSWRRAPEGGFADWDTLARDLPAYAKDLGFTHVELLPISEHPFDGSWGYQTLSQFAPSARFGDPDGLRRFVEACHAMGLGVILDWVPAHFPMDEHGLAQFDGTALYEYADPREGFHRDWNTAIYNFGRTEVRNLLAGSALFWIERYGVDGLRVDAVASMLYRDYSRPAGEWIPNIHGGRENLEAISLLRSVNSILGEHAPGAVTIAEESTAFPGVSRPVYDGGLGFHFKWNMGWMHDTLAYMHEDPVHRRWHHDKMTFGLVYAFSENFVLPLSHDEVVHGKGSLLHKMPGDRWQKFANLRAYYAFMWAHPGKKLLFMGGEFAQEREWNHDTQLDWHLLDQPEHRGVQALIRDLNGVYRRQPALHVHDCDPQGFEWLVANDADQSVFAFLRKSGDQQVMVVCNFTPVPRHDYRVGLPFNGAGAWREILNTDSRIYGGSEVGNLGAAKPVQAIEANGRSHSIALTLPPLATLYLVPA